MPEVIRLLLAGATFATMNVSAYDDSSGMPPWGVTASMTRTRPGVCACPPEFVFGTLFVDIDRMTPYVAYRCEDRGSLVKAGYLDLWFPTRRAALRWGRRDAKFAILRGGVR